MPYGMGQVRYNNSPESYGVLEGNKGTTQDKDDIWQGEYFWKNNIINSYKDYRIRRVTDSSIDPSKVYLLRFKANRNTTYDMIFDLKLCSSTTTEEDGVSTNLSDYQNIRRFTIRRDTSHAASLVSVILFDRSDKSTANGYTDARILDTTSFLDGITITKEGQSAGQELDENRVYTGVKKDENNNTIEEGYFYYNASGEWTRIENNNIAIVPKTWEQSSSEKALKASFDFVIRNNLLNGNNNNINTIVFEMIRQPWDADIENEDDDSKGLKLEGIEWEIYELKNLLPDNNNNNNSIISVSPVSTIGVWGHPNQILTINGEEIRIGQSGYYELTDFEIKNLCIAALGPEDRFTLDYQYKLDD